MRRPPAHTSIRFILQGLKAEDVEKAFREHAANLNSGETVSRVRALALDGKVLKGSFDAFNDTRAKQMLSAFAAGTALVLAHIERPDDLPAIHRRTDIARPSWFIRLRDLMAIATSVARRVSWRDFKVSPMTRL
jgi:hypothetical protein